MGNLGTLWFGADIDLTQLKQKINQGNRDILDGLKLSYDPKSYQDMVNKLKSDLSRETFEIKLSANANNIVNSIKNAGKTNMNVRSIDDMNEKILRQKALVEDLTATVERLKVAWQKNKGSEAYGRFLDSKSELAAETAELRKLNATRKAYNDSMRDTTTTRKNASESARELEKDNIRLNATLFNGIHISSQLGSALNSLYAVHSARQFLDSVIEIGGQLEKQRISMAAIIGDTARANELFESIKNLAIKSPFGVVELDQYSKQLAAYGIEQSNLFNMTKRLADISAGAGQDIGRLALALGHVKSATYLTGITLRQFSMNNIPMLKMLADYYSEVEKRAVSTAEVQKRISKRQVSYEDVLEQIKRMTNEGGKFYNMQEKISESLAAKYKNLRDSFDIMYGEIAESGIGNALKSFAEGATKISRNWKQVISIIGGAAIAFGSYRAVLFATNMVTNNLNASTIAAALSNGKLSASMIDRYVLTGKITLEQLLQAVATKKVTVAEAELAAATYNVTRAQLEQIATSGKYVHMLAATSLATSKFTIAQLRMISSLRHGNLGIFAKGLTSLRLGFSLVTTAAKTATTAIASFLAPLTGFFIFSSIFDSFFESGRKAEETEERLRSMAETANEAYKNMSDVRKKYSVGGSVSMNDEEIQTNITEMVEHLQNYSKTAKETFNNAFAVDEEGKSVHSLSEQYEILAKAIDETTESYRDFNDIRQMVQHSIEAGGGNKGFLDDSFSWIDSVGSYLGFETKGNKLPTLDLKESVSFYAECLNDASKAEQVFLRNRLDVVNVLQNMGIEEAAEMNNEEILIKITEWMLAFPSKFDEFKSQLEGDSKDAFSVVLEKWDELGVASDNAIVRMKRSSRDFFESAKVFWGEDMQKWPKGWQNTVMLALDAVIKDINGFETMSEETQNEIKNIWLKPFKITVDSEEAQTQVNNLLVELQNLVGKDWVVQIGIKGVSSIEDVDAASKSYKKSVEDIASTTRRLNKLKKEGKTGSETWKKTLRDQQLAVSAKEAAQKTILAYGGDIPEVNKKTGGASGSKVDKQLEEWKKQVRLLDKYRQEIDKLRKYMTRAESEAKLKAEGSFSSLFDVFTNPNDYVGSLNEIINLLGTLGDRGNYAKELSAKIGDEGLRQFTENADNAVSELQRMLDVMQENYNVYKKWVDLTGNEKLASQIAGVASNSSYALLLREQYDKLGGAKGIDADAFFDLSESKAKEYGEKNGLYTLWKEWQENNKKLKEDDLQLYEDAIKNAKRYEEKVADINRELEREIEAIKRISNNPQEQQRLIDNATKNADKKKADLSWENFKETEEWGRVFANLEKVSTDTLRSMRNSLVAILPTISESVEATKALYEALEKIDKVVNERNPFKAMGDALKKGSAIKELLNSLKGSADTDTVYISKKTSQKTGVNAGKQTVGNVRKQAKDQSKASQAEFLQSLSGVNSKFEALQDALSPVIDLFDTLGMTDLSNLFSIGNNALGSAMQVAGGLDALGLGVAGPYGAAIAAGFSVVSSLFSMHDEALQEEINASKQRQKEMKNLSDNLEKALSRALGGIYEVANTEQGQYAMDKFTRQSKQYMDVYNERLRLEKELEEVKKQKPSSSFLTGSANKSELDAWEKKVLSLQSQLRNASYVKDDTFEYLKKAEETQKYYDMQRASLAIQRDELEKQISAERNKKDSDSGAITDMEQQLEELKDEIYNFAKDMAKALYDIDVKSWAQQLGDALYDAWKNGENGAEAFRKKAKEIIGDVAKNIVVTKMIETALRPLETAIVDMMDTESGELDPVNFATKVSDILVGVIDKVSPAFETTLEAVDTALKSRGFGSLKDGSGSSASGSIKSITEDKANLLASYMNAMRADVSVQRIDIAAIRVSVEAIANRNVLTQTQESYLENIANYTLRCANASEGILSLIRSATLDKSQGFYMR